jgi:hypothetical protein
MQRAGKSHDENGIRLNSLNNQIEQNEYGMEAALFWRAVTGYILTSVRFSAYKQKERHKSQL